MNPKPVFISYAHADNENPDPQKCWLDILLLHLKPYVRQGDIEFFSDKDIKSGEMWETRIQYALNEARVAILMVSPAFLASDYICDSELPVLLNKAMSEGLTVLSIILKPCGFSAARFKFPDPKRGPQEIKLSVFQAINSPDKTLIEINEGERDRVFSNVAERVRELLNEKAKDIRKTEESQVHEKTIGLPPAKSLKIIKAPINWNSNVADPLDITVLDVLFSLTGYWQEAHIDQLTSIQNDAIKRLMHAGLVEQRFKISAIHQQLNEAISYIVRITGTSDSCTIIKRNVALGMPHWVDARDRLIGNVTICAEGIFQVRLTTNGERARQSSGSGEISRLIPIGHEYPIIGNLKIESEHVYKP